MLAIGVASIAAALAYTGGPWPLGYHGLGELFVFVFFGFVAVCGTAYVQALVVSPVALAASVPVGALATAILVVNNLRDLATDARAGKRTLAVRFGARATRWLYAALLASALLAPVVCSAAFARPALLATLLAAPWAFALARVVGAGASGAALNEVLARTAGLALVHALLCALGWGWPR